MPKKEKEQKETPIIEPVDTDVPLPKQRTILTSPLAINRDEVKRRIFEGRKKVVR